MFNNSTLNEVKAKNTDITVENTVDQRTEPGISTGDSRAAALRATGARSEDARRDSTLSKAHIRPRIEYIRGASLFRSTKDKPMEQVGGGRRGYIKGFSKNSRRRLLEMIASVKRDADLPDFMTLTYPANFPTVERAKRDLKVFLQRLDRAYPGSGYIWKLEPQERGAPHYHLLVWGINDQWELCKWTSDTWFEIAGDGDINHWKFHMGLLRDSKPCVQKVRSFRGVWAYAAKYLGKTFEVAEWGKKWTGRFWGVGKRENIPFGEADSIEVANITVVKVMRLQRRFMAMRGRGNLNSLKTFCDADQWVERIIMGKDQQRNN